MTTYTAIASTAVDAGSPIDEALMTALRDNPLAIQEGDATAPRVQKEAFASEIAPWILLETVTVAASGHGDNIDFGTSTAITGYDTLRIVGFARSATADSEIHFLTGTGGAFDTTVGDYKWVAPHYSLDGTETISNSTSDAEILLTGASDIDGGTDVSFDIMIQAADNSSRNTLITANITGNPSGSPQYLGGRCHAVRAAAQQDTRFRILRENATGEWQSGTFKLYGLRNF